MSSFGIHPRFSQTLDLGLDEARASLARAVEQGDDRCEMNLFARFGRKPGELHTFRLHQIYEAAMGRTVEIH